jgi:D-tyrosyl-tRNA(Tyr) deacylase
MCSTGQPQAVATPCPTSVTAMIDSMGDESTVYYVTRQAAHRAPVKENIPLAFCSAGVL